MQCRLRRFQRHPQFGTGASNKALPSLVLGARIVLQGAQCRQLRQIWRAPTQCLPLLARDHCRAAPSGRPPPRRCLARHRQRGASLSPPRRAPNRVPARSRAPRGACCAAAAATHRSRGGAACACGARRCRGARQPRFSPFHLLGVAPPAPAAHSHRRRRLVPPPPADVAPGPSVWQCQACVARGAFASVRVVPQTCPRVGGGAQHRLHVGARVCGRFGPPPPPYAPFLTPLHAPDRRSAPVSGASPAGTVAAGSSLNRQPFYSDVCSEQTLNRRDIWSTLVRMHGSGSRVCARKRADLPRQAPLKAVVRWPAKNGLVPHEAVHTPQI